MRYKQVKHYPYREREKTLVCSRGQMADLVQIQSIRCGDPNEIWKERVKKERELAKAWPKTWGFLTEVYEQNQKEILQQKQVAIELPFHQKARPPTPPERYIHVEHSPRLPQTTQGLIGWRSGQSHLQLQTFGMVHHGRRSYFKELGSEEPYA